MAALDPMDLPGRSQAFFRDFYLHHQHACDAWYIRDSTHVFTDASLPFLSRFVPSGIHSVCGLEGQDIFPSLTERDLVLLNDFERQASEHQRNITLFCGNVFSDRTGGNAVMARIMPFRPGQGVLVRINDLASLYHRPDWLSAVLPGCGNAAVTDIASGAGDIPAPDTVLTAREWETVWLVITGRPLRRIAELLGVRKQSLDIRLHNACRKLQLSGRHALLQTAARHGWINRVPGRLLPGTVLIRTC